MFIRILKPVEDYRNPPTPYLINLQAQRNSVVGLSLLILSLPPPRGSPIFQEIRYVLLLTLPSVAPAVKLVIKALKGEGAIFCRWQKIVRNKKTQISCLRFFTKQANPHAQTQTHHNWS